MDRLERSAIAVAGLIAVFLVLLAIAWISKQTGAASAVYSVATPTPATKPPSHSRNR
jgi:biopolymer transport protein ExbD